MTDAITLYDRRSRRFGELLDGVGGDQGAAPTRGTDWDGRALVDHVAVQLLWVPPLLDGATVADVGDRFELTPQADQLAATGLSAAPVPVPAGADLQTTLLALVGRPA